MDFIKSDEKIMDLTEGFIDTADGKWFCDCFDRCDKPSFDYLIKSDMSLKKNIEEQAWSEI